MSLTPVQSSALTLLARAGATVRIEPRSRISVGGEGDASEITAGPAVECAIVRLSEEDAYDVPLEALGEDVILAAGNPIALRHVLSELARG